METPTLYIGGVMETKEFSVADGYGDTVYFRMNDETYTFEEMFDKVDAIFKENKCAGGISKSEFREAKNEWDDRTKNGFIENSDDLENFMVYYLPLDYYTFEVVKKDVLTQNAGAFLTKRAAKEYIEKFGYNHSNPRTYAMNAFRNFELERLLNILKTLNVDDIKED